MWYKVAYSLAYAVMILWHRMRIINKPKNADEGMLICANHSSQSDPVYLALSLGINAKLCFMAKKELFFIKPFGAILKSIHIFPVNRSAADVNAIKTSLKYLRAGRSMIIFPEGTSKHKNGREVKSGAGMLALRSGVPVLPVYITEKKRFMSTIDIVFGEPFVPEKPEAKGGDAYHIAAEEIMRRVFAIADSREGIRK